MDGTKPEELTAVFESERTRREGWCVIQLEGGVIANGNVAAGELVPGVTYRFIGKWTTWNNINQFKFTSFVQVAPHSRRGIILYLEKFAPGIGPATANRLVDLYGGENCIGVLKTDPERISRDTRLSLAQAKAAADSLIAIEGIQETKIELMELLDGSGLHSACVDLLIKKHGAKAAVKVKKDPFCLLWPVRMPGAGFSRVDTLYQKLGHPLDKMRRQMHCAVYAVDEDATGSTWVGFAAIESMINDKVTGNINPAKACRMAVRCGLLVREDRDGQPWFAIRRIGEAEVYTANRVQELLGDVSKWYRPTFEPIGSATILKNQRSLALQLTSSTRSDLPYGEEWDF
jgi:hypothetical protein